MELVGLALVALLVLGGTWWLSRLITGVGRNNDSTHGGGTGGATGV